jgi:LysM repeat protein
MLSRIRFARLLWFVLLICAFLAFTPGYAEAEEGLASWHGPGLEGKPTASGVPPQGVAQPSDLRQEAGSQLLPSVGSQQVAQQPDLAGGAAQPLGLTKVSVGEVNDWSSINPNLPQTGVPQGAGVPQGQVQQPDFLLQGVAQPTDPPAQGVAQQPQLLQGMSQQPDAPQGTAHQPGLEQGAAPPSEHMKVSIGEMDHWSFATPNLPQGVTPQGSGTLQEMAQGQYLPQGEVQQPSSSPGAVQDVADRGDYVVQPGDTLSDIASRLGTSVDELASSNSIADPNVIRSGQALHLQQPAAGVDPNFIRGQEGFRLDGYVPDPQSSRSGVTVGTGVDIGQMSAADIGALDIPQGLKQKLAPYAGLIGQNAVNFLYGHPLHLTQDETNTLDRVVTQNTIGGVANRFNLASPGNSFANLPPAARTVVADVAYQYGSNLAQRLPNFWSDVTAGRWDSAAQKLRNFGDRYPTRRNAEADLLQGAMQRGGLGGGYVVQPGDTLSQVASLLRTTVEHLVESNGIADPNTIYSGQTLRA